MKIINCILLIVFALSVSCEKSDTYHDPDILLNPGNSLCLKFGDSLAFDLSQIDFYDFSSHLIYLKEDNSFTYSSTNLFTVFVDSTAIYSGHMFPSYSSLLYAGPVIYCTPPFYGDYVIPIGFIQVTDSSGNKNEDPRNDIRIIETLKKFDKYRGGLSCNIVSIQKLLSGKVRMIIQLKNNDPCNLYYLDPDKMGINLFHYFTNGLFLTDMNGITFTHQTSYRQPEPWNGWSNDWLSVLKSRESKMISIVYEHFENIPPGHYHTVFSFPGLSNQLARDEFQKDNGRIWLGESYATKKIIIK